MFDCGQFPARTFAGSLQCRHQVERRVEVAAGQSPSQRAARGQQFGRRIKELYGKVPGSFEFKAVQQSAQPPADSTDVAAVIRGAIERGLGRVVTALGPAGSTAGEPSDDD